MWGRRKEAAAAKGRTASRTLDETDILEIDDCAPAMAGIPGVLQVYAGDARLMNQLPKLSPDGSLLVLMDVADTFVARCFAVFDVEKFPQEYADREPPPQKVTKVDRREGLALSKRSVMRFRIAKARFRLTSGYRVALQMPVGGSIYRFVEYEAAAPQDIFAFVRDALG